MKKQNFISIVHRFILVALLVPLNGLLIAAQRPSPHFQTVTWAIGDNTFVQSNYPNLVKGGSRNVYIGRDYLYNKGLTRGYFKPVLGNLPSGAQITRAQLYYYLYARSCASGSPLSHTAYEVTGNWNLNSLTWNHQPSWGGVVGSASFTCTFGWKTMDLTNLVQRWVQGTSNNGFVIRANNESAAGAVFWSSNCYTYECPGQQHSYLQIDYTVPPSTFKVSGRITDSAGRGVSGVTLTATGGITTTTDTAGNYTLTGLKNGAYTLTPSKGGYAFDPASRTINVAGGDLLGQNFTLVAVAGRLAVSSTNVLSGQALLFLASIQATANKPALGLTNVTIRVGGQSYPLYDDGTQGDFTSRDGLYTAFIPMRDTGTISATLFVVSTPFQSLNLTGLDDPKLMVLTDWAALYAEFRDTGMAAVTAQEDRNQNGLHDFFDLVVRLNSYAAAHHGIVVDIAHAITASAGFSDNYSDLAYGDSTDVRYHKSVLIDQLITTLNDRTLSSLRNVALIGDDQVVPSYRVFDPTDYFWKYSGDSTNRSAERKYPGTIGGVQNNAVLRDLRQGYLLSDVPYSIRTTQIITPETWLLPDPDEGVLEPTPDMGIGRVFTSHPTDLIQAIDRYEQPLPLPEGQAEARVFLGDDPRLDFPLLSGRSVIGQLNAWFGDHLTVYNSQEKLWFPPDFVAALSSANLVSLWGHAYHETVQIQGPVEIKATDLNALSSFGPRVLIGFGCHLGLSVSNYPDGVGLTDPFANALVNPIVAKGITLFAPTSQAYVYIPSQGYDTPNLHELMVSLFTNGLTDRTLPTVGNVWQALFPFYNSKDPGKDLNNNPGSDLFHFLGAYGIGLYGLPTQPIERTPAASLQALYNPQLEPAPLSATAMGMNPPTSVTISIHNFKVTRLPDGTTFFSAANGGTHLGPPNGPQLPQVIQTIALPDNFIVAGVRLAGSESYPYPTPVTLANSSLSTTNGELITGTYSLPAVYPENLFKYSVVHNGNGSQLIIGVIPLRYSSLNHQVTLYTSFRFQIDYIVSASPSGPFLSDVTVNAGKALRLGQTGQTLQVKIRSSASKPTNLLWNIRDRAGYSIDSGNALVNVLAGTSTLTFPLDTTGWLPGPKDLIVSLQTDDDFPDTRNIPLLVEGIELSDVGFQSQIYPFTAREAVWQLAVRDEYGALVTNLASAFSATVDGQPVTINVQESQPGTYQLRLGLTSIASGDHLVRIRVTDIRGITAQQNWPLIMGAAQYFSYFAILEN
jgi:hypothetical protein